MTPPPDAEFLQSLVRWAMGRGLPPQAAEDVVFEGWQRAQGLYDSNKGPFEPYLQRVVRNGCAQWWRDRGRAARALASPMLVLVEDPLPLEVASANQQRLLDALSDAERRVFSAWALQKHLGKGQVSSETLARSLSMEPSAYDNAKRRLRYRLQQLLDTLGLSPASLIHGVDDVEHTG